MVLRRDSLALLGVSLLGLAARLHFLGRPMQYDEAATFNEYASRPLLDGLSLYTFPNNHLLNTLLVHVSIQLFGDRPWAVRLPALVAGTLLIPATYVMVAGLAGRRGAIFASALVASAAAMIDYSSNARGYAFVALFTVLLADRARRIVAEGGRVVDWAAFAVFGSLGFFAMPIMLYPYGGLLLWIGGAGLRRRASGAGGLRLDRMLLATVATAILTLGFYGPVLLRTGPASLVANRFVAPQPLDQVVRGLPLSLASAWRQWHLDVPRPLAFAGLLAWAGTPWIRGRDGRGHGLSGVFVTVVAWSLAVALAQRVVPPDRVWIFAFPLYAGCVGSALAGLVERLPRGRGEGSGLAPALAFLLALGLTAAVLRGGSLLRSTRDASLFHAEAIAEWLEPRLGPGDAVIAVVPCDAPLKYAFLVRGLPVEPLYDYRIARARRLYVAVERPGQTLRDVLNAAGVPPPRFGEARAVQDLGESVLYQLDRP